jgi:hypothetical protein
MLQAYMRHRGHLTINVISEFRITVFCDRKHRYTSWVCIRDQYNVQISNNYLFLTCTKLIKLRSFHLSKFQLRNYYTNFD